MNIKKIIAIYFSPNGMTKKIVNKLAKDIGDYDIEEINLNSIENRNIKRSFKKYEMVIIGFPVYGDRLPELSKDIFKNLKGNNTPAIAIVSYGNREYGDALLELKNNLIKSDMKFISGAAIVAEHCLNKNIAANRPDEKDDLKILAYSNLIKNKIKNIQRIEELQDIHVKGNYPYRPLKNYQVPTGDEKCTECGLCEKNCPANAIDGSNYRLTDSNICICCSSCINICPAGARAIRNEEFINRIKKLEDLTKERKEIEVFI